MIFVLEKLTDKNVDHFSPGRQFNMSRELTEESSTFIQRIQANVGKVVNKKKKKGGEEVTVEVKFFKLDEDLNLGTILMLFLYSCQGNWKKSGFYFSWLTLSPLAVFRVYRKMYSLLN